MNNLQIKGNQKFLEMEIPQIEGGFGEGQRVILAKTVAEIHDVETKYVNKLINNNINRFGTNDLIDLKTGSLEELVLENKLFTKAQWGNSNNIYLLSERGYTKLVSMLDNTNDKKWEVMDKLIDEYFTMREIINSDEQLKAQLLLSIYNGGQEGVLASKQLTEIEVKEATAPLLTKIENDKPLVDFAESIASNTDSIEIGVFSKLLKDEGVKMGRNKLFEYLRDNKFLMKNNIPYQNYIDNGYFEIIEYSVHTPYGDKLATKTLITGRGQIKIMEKLKKLNN